MKGSELPSESKETSCMAFSLWLPVHLETIVYQKCINFVLWLIKILIMPHYMVGPQNHRFALIHLAIRMDMLYKKRNAMVH